MEILFLIIPIILLIFSYIYIYFLKPTKVKNESTKKLNRNQILEKSYLFTIDDTNFIKNTDLLTLEEKKNLIIDIYSKDGFIVNNISDNQIQFKKEKTFSLLWAIVWLFVAIVGIIIYIFYYMSKEDTIVTVTIDPSKCKQESTKEETEKINNNDKTKKLLELKDMLEKDLITKDEFDELKVEVLK